MRFPIHYGIEKNGLPFIIVTVKGNNICFVIDTGATGNLLDQAVYEYFKDITEVAGNGTCSNTDGNTEQTIKVQLPFTFEEEPYSEIFLIKDLSQASSCMVEEGGLPLNGILGTGFFLKHKWIIDYSTCEIYTPDEKPKERSRPSDKNETM